MARNRSAWRGCLLGMAVGDAMGYTVNSHSLQEIREDYGPYGLRGYDPVNGYADITSNTQLAAFTANGLLYAMTMGRQKGTMSPFIQYISRSHWEWASSQQAWDRPSRTVCWLFKEKSMCHRHCLDTRMKEIILRKQLRTPEEPGNTMTTATSLCSAVGVGVFYDGESLSRRETCRLGMEAVALTHGDPMAFLPGALVANLIIKVLEDQKPPMETLVQTALEEFREQFSREYSRHTEQVCALVRQAVALALDPSVKAVDAMERLQCRTGAQVLAGAIYAVISCGWDFDASLIAAVNHSGASAPVGALVGAIHGARMGEDALPEFYLECLECRDVLEELADDLYHGCPVEKGDVFFDDEWDSKYCHGSR